METKQLTWADFLPNETPAARKGTVYLLRPFWGHPIGTRARIKVTRGESWLHLSETEQRIAASARVFVTDDGALFSRVAPIEHGDEN